MKSQNVIYISNECIHVVVGEKQRDTVRVLKYFHVPLLEGAILNGVIIDDNVIKDSLKTVFQKGIKEVSLIVDSAKILAKPAVIPSMNEKQAIQFVKDELSTIGENSEDIVYDFGYLSEDDMVKGASKILCVGVERQFVSSYLDVFSEVGIEVVSIDYAINVLISLTKSLSGFIDKTYAVIEVDGPNITSVLFTKNEYSLTNRSRVFSTRGTSDYEDEILGIVSQLKQFAIANQNDVPLSDVYIFGLSQQEQDNVFEKIQTSLSVKAQVVPKSKLVYAVEENSESFDINDYVYSIGYLLRK